jgi:hypothetical protein
MAGFLGNSVLNALVIPILAALAAAGWKVLAKPSRPTREDWLVGWDLMLAAAVLVLIGAAGRFAYLDSNPGDAATIWVLWLRLAQLIAIFAAQSIIAIVVKSNYEDNPYLPFEPAQPNERAMRWCNIGGGALLTVTFLVNSYSYELYDVWVGVVG